MFNTDSPELEVCISRTLVELTSTCQGGKRVCSKLCGVGARGEREFDGSVLDCCSSQEHVMVTRNTLCHEELVMVTRSKL